MVVQPVGHETREREHPHADAPRIGHEIEQRERQTRGEGIEQHVQGTIDRVGVLAAVAGELRDEAAIEGAAHARRHNIPEPA